ncbi:MAG TPA: hypothetical protein VEG65_07190 [Candidatus Bathyarchaeia archaeon]|nr:hypothetical protein [Candidatus Bathyarchaeia archaeon]
MLILSSCVCSRLSLAVAEDLVHVEDLLTDAVEALCGSHKV